MRKPIVVAVTLALLAVLVSCATSAFNVARTGTPQDVQTAINKGADVNARQNGGMTPLMLAAGFNEDPEVATTLLEAGANVDAQNKNGETALMWAAQYNTNPEMIATLLKAGAKIETQTKALGQTALMWAASYNTNPEVVTILLKAGADGKVKSNEGKTAFDYAQGNERLKGTDAYQLLQEASQ
jgi:ankyrin repeat protein